MTSIFENPDSNLFFTPIQALLASTSLSSALDEAAARLVAAVTTSSRRLIYIYIEARRNWDSVGESHNGYYLRFCILAALLKATNGKGGVHPVWVFYACHDVLENTGPQSQPNAHRMSPEKLWELDVRIAAKWVRDGSRALWEMDHEEPRQHWAAALDDKTDLRLREDGLARE